MGEHRCAYKGQKVQESQMLLRSVVLSSLLLLDANAQRKFSLFADVKDTIDVAPYSPEQRVQVAKALVNMFSVLIIN